MNFETKYDRKYETVRSASTDGLVCSNLSTLFLSQKKVSINDEMNLDTAALWILAAMFFALTPVIEIV